MVYLALALLAAVLSPAAAGRKLSAASAPSADSLVAAAPAKVSGVDVPRAAHAHRTQGAGPSALLHCASGQIPDRLRRGLADPAGPGVVLHRGKGGNVVRRRPHVRLECGLRILFPPRSAPAILPPDFPPNQLRFFCGLRPQLLPHEVARDGVDSQQGERVCHHRRSCAGRPAVAHPPPPLLQNYATYVKGALVPGLFFSYSVGHAPKVITASVSSLMATIAAHKAATLVVTLPAGTNLTAASLDFVPPPYWPPSPDNKLGFLLDLRKVTGNLTIACAVVSEPPACAIDGEHKYQLVAVDGGVVNLVGLTLRNGNAFGICPGTHFCEGGNGGDVLLINGSVDAAGDLFSSDTAEPGNYYYGDYHYESYGGAVDVQHGFFNATGATFRNDVALVRTSLSLPPACAVSACALL